MDQNTLLHHNSFFHVFISLFTLSSILSTASRPAYRGMYDGGRTQRDATNLGDHNSFWGLQLVFSRRIGGKGTDPTSSDSSSKFW